MTFRLMVTGGRDWTDASKIRDALDTVTDEDVTLIHGACDGADKLCEEYAIMRGWKWQRYPYEKRHGRAGGPIRNAAMVRSGPDIVFAFPTPRSKGTWDAVTRARKAGIKVVVVR